MQYGSARKVNLVIAPDVSDYIKPDIDYGSFDITTLPYGVTLQMLQVTEPSKRYDMITVFRFADVVRPSDWRSFCCALPRKLTFTGFVNIELFSTEDLEVVRPILEENFGVVEVEADYDQDGIFTIIVSCRTPKVKMAFATEFVAGQDMTTHYGGGGGDRVSNILAGMYD